MCQRLLGTHARRGVVVDSLEEQEPHAAMPWEETTCGVYNKMVGGWTGISFGSTLSTSFHRALTVTLIDLAVGVTAAAAIVSYISQ
jgi:hypothetical protein